MHHQVITSLAGEMYRLPLYAHSDEQEFSAPLVLARVLEGTEQRGALSQALVSPTTCRDVACYVSTLGEAFQSLPSTQQSQIRNRWGSHLNEILSLSRETDTELFHEALFHLGQRLEHEGHTEQAGLIYSSLLPSALTPLPSVAQTIQQQAQERIAVLQGGGSLGNQMEHMGRGFARSALDPGLLLGASSMGLFGKGVELIGMRYLAGANFFRRSYGLARTALELAPKATGFALEATAFPYAINGANELLGRPVSWAHMDHRILGSWFFLGGMRMGGGFGRMASQRFGIAGLQPLGSIAGVGLGHGGEVLAGLKDWHGFSNFAVETFGTWANLQVAGRFSEYVFDGQISRVQRVMDLSIEGGKRGRGEEGKRRGFGEWVDSISEAFNNLSGPTPLAATAAAGHFPSPSPRLFPSSPRSPSPLVDGKSYMAATGGGGREGPGGGSPKIPSEAALLANPVFLEQRNQTLRDAHITINGESVVVSANAAVEAIFGYSPSELIGDKMTRLIPNRDGLRESHTAGVQRYFKPPHVAKLPRDKPIVLPALHRKGHEIWVEVVFGEPFQIEGKVYLTGSARDVTDRVMTENRLKEAEAERQRLEAELKALSGQEKLPRDPDGAFRFTLMMEAANELKREDSEIAASLLDANQVVRMRGQISAAAFGKYVSPFSKIFSSQDKRMLQEKNREYPLGRQLRVELIPAEGGRANVYFILKKTKEGVEVEDYNGGQESPAKITGRIRRPVETSVPPSQPEEPSSVEPTKPSRWSWEGVKQALRGGKPATEGPEAIRLEQSRLRREFLQAAQDFRRAIAMGDVELRLKGRFQAEAVEAELPSMIRRLNSLVSSGERFQGRRVFINVELESGPIRIELIAGPNGFEKSEIP